MGLGPTFAVVALGQSISGACTGILATNSYALAAVTGDDANRARTMGCAKACLYIGPTLGQAMLEPVVNVSDAGTGLAVLGLYAAALAAGSLVYGFNTRHKRAAAMS
jgi:hypothetical protein